MVVVVVLISIKTKCGKLLDGTRSVASCCVFQVSTLHMYVCVRVRGGVRGVQPADPASSSPAPRNFFAFCSYIHHTRPDPITKRISAIPASKWWDVGHIHVCRADTHSTTRAAKIPGVACK